MKAFSKCFLALFVLCVILLPACQKEITQANDESADLTNKSMSSSKLAHRIIVHAGSSIQAAVNTAEAGFIIQIDPGVYKEAIVVNTPGIQLIGSGKGVIIQNPGDEENGITVNDNGDGFVLKNVTVQNFKENGIVLTSVDNFTISRVTAINNGEYGIFPVHSSHGVIEFCMVKGHSDTGIYVGQSSDVKMEFNAAFENVNGLEVENSSNVSVTHNESFNNVCGILIDLLPGKDIKTSSNIYVGNNKVISNNHVNFGTPGSLESVVPKGLGILVLGADQTTVENNIVIGNDFAGITVFSTLVLGSLAGIPPAAFADIDPNPDNAKIIGNFVRKNGSAPPSLAIPLPGVDFLWDGSGANNCWKNNIYDSSYPSPLPTCN
ncbi:MAG: parallel beta-helix domain-containing protein [Chitinophagales bacterium]